MFLYAKSRKLFENYSNKKTVEIRLVCFCLKSPMVGGLPSFWNDFSIPAMVEKWIKLYKRLKLFRLNGINSKVNSRFYLSSTFLFKSYKWYQWSPRKLLLHILPQFWEHKIRKNMIFACNEYTIFSTDWNLLSEWFDSFLSSLMKIRWKLIQFICSSAKVHSISLFFIVGSTCKRSSFICSEVNWRRLPLPNNSKPTQN